MRRSALLVAAAAFVANANAQGSYGDLCGPLVLRLSEIIGIEVLTPEGYPLGRITDLYFDRASGGVEEVAVGAARYPVSALVSGDAPRQIVLEPQLARFASAGASALLASDGKSLSLASREPGSPDRVLVDLLQGRVRLEP
jgi:sporulation protein YlmC with PRC-barrel domain